MSENKYENLTLSECRALLDQIDPQIVALYEQRMDISEQVARVKMQTGKMVLDKQREREKLSRVESLVEKKENRMGVRELFELIMSIGRKRQYTMMNDNNVGSQLSFLPVERLLEPGMRVVYQGAEGSYSEAAMRKFFGDDVENIHVESFRDAMIAVEDGAASYAVLPIENSTAGSVSQIYDLLVEFENYIVGEQIIKIEHCLMAPEGATLDTIRKIYSHPQSLMQSSRYLNAHPQFEQISMLNNAFAAMKVAEDQDITQAAIASEIAAKRYGLQILKKGVNQSNTNSTRFIVVSPRKIYQRNAGQISLCVEIAHESGSLYHILSHFIYNNLSMTRIESRPIEGRNWEYRFFIDFEGSLEDPGVRNALRGIREEVSHLRILGAY